MRAISFIFQPGISSDRRQALLDEINTWITIEKAAPLRPDSAHPDISRMANAYLTEDADADQVVRQLNEIPEIASASVPPRRRLT